MGHSKMASTKNQIFAAPNPSSLFVTHLTDLHPFFHHHFTQYFMSESLKCGEAWGSVGRCGVFLEKVKHWLPLLQLHPPPPTPHSKTHGGDDKYLINTTCEQHT